MSVNIWGLPQVNDWLTLGPVRQRLWHQQDLFHKFKIVFDGPEDAGGAGCFCAPRQKKKPVFQAGGMITGHVVLKPAKFVTVTGLELIFGGKYTVRWEDEESMWGGYETIFTERGIIMTDTVLDLTAGAYSFEFAYALPDYLPPALKEPEGFSSFYVYGKVHVSHGLAWVQTTDVAFDVIAALDIGRVSKVLHSSMGLKKRLSFPLKGQPPRRGGTDGQGLVVLDLRLNKRAFVGGEHILADVIVDNQLTGQVSCKVSFQRVICFTSDHAVRVTYDRVETADHSRTKMRSTLTNIGSTVTVNIAANSNKTFSKMFDVAPDPMPSSVRKWPENEEAIEAMSHQFMPVRVSYHIVYEVCPAWTMAKSVRVPLVVGTSDCGQRLLESPRPPELLYVDFRGPYSYAEHRDNRQDPPPFACPSQPPPDYEDCV